MEDMDEATIKTLVAEGPQCYLEIDDINNVASCNKATYLATGHLLNAAAGTSGYMLSSRGRMKMVGRALLSCMPLMILF